MADNGNTKGWDDVRTRVADLGRATARAGIVGPEAHQKHTGSNLTLLELALIHEFGSPSAGLPERSFIRAALEQPEVKAELARLMAVTVREVVAGRMSRDAALRAIGGYAAAQIRQFVLDNKVRPPDAPSTVARKGHDVVLIGETRELVDAIGYDLVK